MDKIISELHLKDRAPVPASPAEAFYWLMKKERGYLDLANAHPDTSEEDTADNVPEITAADLDAAEKFYNGQQSPENLAAATKLVTARQAHLAEVNSSLKSEQQLADLANQFVNSTKVLA